MKGPPAGNKTMKGPPADTEALPASRIEFVLTFCKYEVERVCWSWCILKGQSNGTVGRARNPRLSYHVPGTCYEYRRVVRQGYYNSSSSNRQTTELTAAVSSFLTIQPCAPGPLSSLLPCMRVLLSYVPGIYYCPRDS